MAPGTQRRRSPCIRVVGVEGNENFGKLEEILEQIFLRTNDQAQRISRGSLLLFKYPPL